MAISEFEIKRCERELGKFLERKRPPAYMRDKLDIGYRVENQSIVLLEIRPVWNDPQTKQEYPFAKTTYVKKTKIWKIYWQRQDLKWHKYEPLPEVKYFEEFIATVEEDANACFFG